MVPHRRSGVRASLSSQPWKVNDDTRWNFPLTAIHRLGLYIPVVAEQFPVRTSFDLVDWSDREQIDVKWAGELELVTIN